MDLAVLEQLLRAGKLSVNDAVSQTPTPQLDELLERLKRGWPADEVCRALRDRIVTAPLVDFETLKGLYFKHCSDS
jgi:hypothetical protein